MFKVLLSGVLIVHGAIHLMGFVKSRNPGAFPGLSLPVGKAWGVFWLVTAVLLIATAALKLASVRWWWAPAFVAVALSQIAIISGWQDAKFGTILNVVALLAAAVGFGTYQFDARTRSFEEQLERSAAVSEPSAPEQRATKERRVTQERLPAPVERYLRKVVPQSAPEVRGVLLEQMGTFNVGEGAESWKPFTATHRATTEPPGFVWAARVRFLPGLAVLVHDAYVEQRGTLAPWFLGLFPLGEVTDEGGEVARGELFRFLAEAPWYPTVLGSDRITWRAVDEQRAEATLSDGAVTATVTYTFGADDLVESIRADDRSRFVKGKMIPTPWVGRFGDYEKRAGLLIPTRCEVEWLLPEGPWAYFRGRVRGYRVVE